MVKHRGNESAVRLLTLGGLALEQPMFSRPKPLLLLAFVAVEGPHCRRRLADLLWMDARDARDSLSTAVRRLNGRDRRLVGIDGDCLEATVTCDALEFQHAVRTRQFERAIGLYSGPFLEGISVPIGEEIEEWVYATRERLASQTRQAHLQLARDALMREDSTAAADHAELALDMPHAPPLEVYEVEALLSVLLATRSPRASEARRLAREAGVGVEALLPVPDGVGIRRTPAIRHGTSITPPAPTAVSAFTGRFVGRREELAQIIDALQEPYVRLLTLHGPGGVGKSRLAAQAACEVVATGDFEVVHMVPLESLCTREQIPYAIASALGAQLTPQAPLVPQLQDRLGDKRVLLVLDDAEHVLPITALVNDLLLACENLKLLVTSRVKLNTQNEHIFPVAGLPIDDSNEESWDALKLFVCRARKARLDFDLTEEQHSSARRICELVHGHPLGIELAASWVHSLTPEQIASEIEASVGLLSSNQLDVPRRQESLREVFNHSWKLLDAEAQTALRRLAVFCDGFTREAARAVSGVSIETLRVLTDASMLRVGPDGRFERDPAVLEMALEKLEEHPAEAATYRERHSAYLLDFGARVEHGILRGPRLPQAAHTTVPELPNVEPAWARAASSGRCEKLALGSFALMLWSEIRGGREAKLAALIASVAAAHAAGAEHSAAPAAERIAWALDVAHDEQQGLHT